MANDNAAVCKPSVLGAVVLLFFGVNQLMSVLGLLYAGQLWWQRSEGMPRSMGWAVVLFGVLVAGQCALYAAWVYRWQHCNGLSGFLLYFFGVIGMWVVFAVVFPCKECQLMNRATLQYEQQQQAVVVVSGP